MKVKTNYDRVGSERGKFYANLRSISSVLTEIVLILFFLCFDMCVFKGGCCGFVIQPNIWNFCTYADVITIQNKM